MKKWAIAAVLTFTALTFIAGGCAESSSSTTESTPSGKTDAGAQATSTNNDGELVYGTSSLGSDNFYIVGGLPPAWVQLTSDRLIRFNYDNEPEGFYPMLAEKWEFSPDYKYLDLYLRQGVQWQGGYGELTAGDVVYTFETLQRSPDSWQAWWWDPPEKGGFIESVEAVNESQVRFNFSAPPYPAWLTDFSMPYMGIESKKYVEEVGPEKAVQEPIGTGPWKLIEHVPGSYMKFERFDQYWGAQPEFKYLTVRNVPESETQIAMLKTGEADIVGISPDKLEEVKAGGFQVFGIPEAEGNYIIFGGQLLSSDPNFDPTVPWASHTDEPADSEWNQRALKVRKALNLAINREAIRSTIMYGAAEPMSTYLWPPSIPDYESSWKDIPYDPAQAKQLLAEAGYPNGFEKPITMYVDSGNTYAGATGKQMALAVANDYEAIGLKIDRRMIDSNAFSELWYKGHEDAWGMSAMRRGIYPEITIMWPWLLASNAPSHEAFMSPDFDKIVSEYNQSMTKTQEERTKLAQAGIDYIYNNYLFAPIAFSKKLSAVGPKVRNITQYEKYAQYTDPGVNFNFVNPAQ